MNKEEKKKETKKVVKKAVEKTMGKKFAGVHSMALRQSTYLATLMDPWNVVGEKIPDDVTTPSFTFQTVTRVLATTLAPAAGPAGFGCTVPVGVSYEPATNVTGTAAYAFVPQASSAVYQLVSARNYFSTAQPWIVPIQSVAAVARPVSAELNVNIYGSPNSITGRLLIGYAPPGAGNQTGVGTNEASLFTAGANWSAATLLQTFTVAEIPAAKLFARSRYLPTDPLSRQYLQTGFQMTVNNRGTGCGSQYGTLFCIWDGAPVGQSVEFIAVQNWEAIPSSSTLNMMTPTVSKSDPIELSAASNIVAAAPTLSVMQSSSATISGTPFEAQKSVAHRVTEQSSDTVGSSFMDKALGFGDSLIAFGKKAAPIVGKVAPLIAGLLA
jgi:hypothetical protein